MKILQLIYKIEIHKFDLFADITSGHANRNKTALRDVMCNVSTVLRHLSIVIKY
jgi:hypothetical protein